MDMSEPLAHHCITP